MIRYVEEWMVEGWNTLKYEEDEVMDAGREFFGKNGRVVGVRKIIIFY